MELFNFSLIFSFGTSLKKETAPLRSSTSYFPLSQEIGSKRWVTFINPEMSWTSISESFTFFSTVRFMAPLFESPEAPIIRKRWSMWTSPFPWRSPERSYKWRSPGWRRWSSLNESNFRGLSFKKNLGWGIWIPPVSIPLFLIIVWKAKLVYAALFFY